MIFLPYPNFLCACFNSAWDFISFLLISFFSSLGLYSCPRTHNGWFSFLFLHLTLEIERKWKEISILLLFAFDLWAELVSCYNSLSSFCLPHILLVVDYRSLILLLKLTVIEMLKLNITDSRSFPRFFRCLFIPCPCCAFAFFLFVGRHFTWKGTFGSLHKAREQMRLGETLAEEKMGRRIHRRQREPVSDEEEKRFSLLLLPSRRLVVTTRKTTFDLELSLSCCVFAVCLMLFHSLRPAA